MLALGCVIHHPGYVTTSWQIRATYDQPFLTISEQGRWHQVVRRVPPGGAPLCRLPGRPRPSHRHVGGRAAFGLGKVVLFTVFNGGIIPNLVSVL